MKTHTSLTAGFRRKNYGVIAALAIVSLTTISLTANAQSTYNWDPAFTNGASGGGAGTWDTNTTADWFDGTSDVVWTDTTGVDTAVFGNAASAATVTLAGNETANALIFNSNNYTLTGGTLTFAGTTPTITVASGDSATISSVIADDGSGFTYAGAGTLTLSGTNTYSGGTILSSGTVIAGNASAFGTGTITLQGGTLNPNGYGTSVTTPIANNLFVGSGQTGNIVFGANSYLSGSLLGSGTLNISTTAASSLYLGGSMSGFTGTLNIDTSHANVDGYFGTGNNDYGSTSAAFIVNSTSSTYSFSILRGSAYDMGSLTGDGYINSTSSGSGTTTVSIGALNTSGTFSGVFGNANLAVTKVGTGTLTLSGNSTNGGGFNVNGGTLVIAGSIANSAVNVANSATFLVNGTTGTGAVTVASGGILGGMGDIGGPITVATGGTISITAGLTDATGTLLTTTDLTLNGTYKLNLNSTLGTSDTLNVGGTLTLSGATLSLNELGSGTSSTPLIIANYSSSLVGTFNGLAQGAQIGNYTIDYDYLENNDIALIAIPEPSTFVLAGIFGFGMLLLFRRRKGIANLA